jgi:hypothetical protein
MRIKIEVKNEILGDSVFWTGDIKDIHELEKMNIVAHQLALHIRMHKKPISSGMWHASIMDKQ